MKNGNFSRDQLIAILQNHINNVMGHYKDTIKIWDVVKVPFLRSDNPPTHDPNGLNDTNFWYKGIGPVSPSTQQADTLCLLPESNKSLIQIYSHLSMWTTSPLKNNPQHRS